MSDYSFQRICRTSYSEAYEILQDHETIGRVDIHFTPTIVYGALMVVEHFSSDQIGAIIAAIDEELILTADVPRDDFLVTVYRGQHIGVFRDEDFEEDTNHQ